MAVTNGWGQAAKNNTNGYGKLATNNIGAGSIYENSYAGDTALIGVSAAFSYSAASFTQADSNPTPTITGTTGGVFSGTSGLVFVSTSTGEINLSVSSIAAHVVTYTVDGVSADFSLSVTSAPYVSTRSFSFDGVNDYFDLGFMPSLDAVQQFSISAWVNMPNVSGTKRMIGKRFDSVNNIAFNFSNNVLFTTINGSFGSANANFTVNTWFHIIMIFNGTLTGNSNRLKLYINGVQQTLSFSGTIPSITYDFSLNPSIFYLGTDGFSTPNYYDGLMDEVSIWDSALSSDAVTEIAAGPNDLTSLTNASSSNLVAWYKMGE